MKKTKQEQQLIPNTQEETQDNIQPTEVSQENVAPQSNRQDRKGFAVSTLPEINQEVQDITPQTLEPQKQVITEQKTEPLMPEQLPNISPNVGGFDFSDEEDQEWEKGYNEDNLKMDTINTLMDKRGGLTRQEKATIKTFLPRAFNIAKRNSKDRGEALSKLYNLTTLDDDGLPRNLIEDPDETAQGARAVATNTLMNYANTVNVPQAMSHDVQLLGRYISQAVNSNDVITRRAAAKKAKDLTEKLKNAGIDDDETKSWIFLYEYRNPLEYAGHANLSDDDVIYVNRKFKGEPLLASMEPVDGWDTVKVGDLRKAAVAHMFGFNSSYKDKFTTGLFGKDEIPYKDIPNIDALNNPELWTDVDDFKKQRASKDGLYFASNWDRLETIAKNTGDMNKTLELLVGVLMADKKMTREQAEKEAARIMKENQEKEAAHQAELDRIKAEKAKLEDEYRKDRAKQLDDEAKRAKEDKKKKRAEALSTGASKAVTLISPKYKGSSVKDLQEVDRKWNENKENLQNTIVALSGGLNSVNAGARPEVDALIRELTDLNDNIVIDTFGGSGMSNRHTEAINEIQKKIKALQGNPVYKGISDFLNTANIAIATYNTLSNVIKDKSNEVSGIKNMYTHLTDDEGWETIAITMDEDTKKEWLEYFKENGMQPNKKNFISSYIKESIPTISLENYNSVDASNALNDPRVKQVLNEWVVPCLDGITTWFLNRVKKRPDEGNKPKLKGDTSEVIDLKDLYDMIGLTYVQPSVDKNGNYVFEDLKELKKRPGVMLYLLNPDNVKARGLTDYNKRLEFIKSFK